jgi:RNA polymerase sigma-70 factor (ECF subfamily)
LIEEELNALIQKCLDKLPHLTRQVFELSRFSGMKYQAIADVTGLSFDSVKYHMKAALVKLRNDLKYTAAMY